MELSRLRSLALILVATASFACSDDGDPPAAADSTGGNGSTSAATTNVSASGQADTGALDSTGGAVSTGMADGSFLSPSTGADDGPMGPQPNGANCTGPADCESMQCFNIPMLGGICSECLTDDDCEMGTCALDPTALYAVCTDGSIGLMCSSDEGCMGDLVCAELINTGGLFPLDFCSECRDDVPCDKGQICAPVYDLGNFAGYQGCVDPGSVPNGGGCPLDGVMGDGAACESGFCGTATLLDLLPVGVCGECITDEDCPGPGETCMPGAADKTGLVGATCV